MSLQLLLRDTKAPDQITDLFLGPADEDLFSGVRCPLCAWRPTASSRWWCSSFGTPEPFFHACGTEWNTFATRGRCPRCQHRWQWTSCHQCGQWSLHDDWYTAKENRQ